MSKNTNLSFLTDFLTADIVNSRVGMNNVSPQTTFDVTGTGKFSGILTLGSTVSNGTYTYTLPSATGTLALTSDIPSVSGYVPYTGATQAVDLGTNDLTSRYVVANGSPALGGVISMKQDAAYIAKGNGYSSIASSFNSFDFFGYTGASTYKNFQLRFDGLTNNTLRTYTLPDADGTIALVGGSGVGTVTSVAAITLGTSGTDLTSTVANGTTTPVITLNVPDASVTARGVITTGTQYIAGLKIFTSTIVANVDLQLPAAGTASTTFIKNISGSGLTSIGSNGFGFNNSDNIYFSGSNKAGGVFAFNNTGNRTYTLQDASGTLAFTSEIPTNAVGGTGTLNTIPKFTAATTIGNSNIFDSGSIIYNTNPAAGTFAWQFNGSTVTGQSYGAQVIAGTNASDIGFKVMNAAASINYLVVRGDGLVTLTGALNGTSAVFSSTVSATQYTATSTGGSGLRVYGSSGTNQWDIYLNSTNLRFSDNTGTGSVVFDRPLNGNIAIFTGQVKAGDTSFGALNGFVINYSASASSRSWRLANDLNTFGDFQIQQSTTQTGTTYANVLGFNSTGAATFSSSVTALNLDLKGTATVQGNTFAPIDFYNSGNIAAAIRPIRFNDETAADLTFWTRAYLGSITERMRITSAGNVGIGTASPEHKLDVRSPSGNNIIRSNVTITSDGQQAILATSAIWSGAERGVSFSIYKHSAITNPASYVSFFGGGSAFRYMFIDDSGVLRLSESSSDIGTYGGTVVGTQTSDIRLKNVKDEFIYGLKEILQINPIAFTFKKDENQVKKIGFAAQEIINIIPESVYDTGNCIDGYEDTDDPMLKIAKSNDTILAMDYSVIIPVLVKAIQEQQVQIDKLKNS